ncbi:MAG TPA: hypothetical protein VKH42_13095 [Vicinamibacterales bacterium]|nr:hypothetical protein [Vicinamibacterales bacterium]
MRLLLTVAFVAIISLPLAATLAGHDGADPAAENRELAAFPTHASGSMADFGAGLTRWFDDHFAFRSTLIKSYGEERLFWFGVSPSAAVVAGSNGWFFYADDNAIDDYASASLLTPEAIANWRQTVVDAHRWLQGRGVAYVFTVAPDKHSIYPEEMPSSIVRIGEMSRTDQLLTALQDTGYAVDLRPALFQAKAHERIYQRTDTHWNDRGALAAYQQIIAAVRARVPAVPPAWTRTDFDAVTLNGESGDLASMMGLKRVLREEDLVLRARTPRLARVVEPAGVAPTAEEGRLVTEIPGSTLPRAVVFRDSFMSRLVPFLSEHFSRVVYLWQNDFDADVVGREHPDVVIQEIVGRHLYGFIPSPELVPH